MKYQSISLNIEVRRLRFFKGDVSLPPNESYELMIDYPLSEPAKYIIKTGKKGLGLGALLNKICSCYEKVYAATEKYGVWGHGIEDLAIEGIVVDHENKTIRLSVGS